MNDLIAIDAAPAQSGDQLFGKRFLRKLIVPIVLAVAVYASLLLYGDFHAVARAIVDLPVATLIFVVALSLLSFALRAIRWVFYLRISNIAVPLIDAVLVFLIGLGMSITPGKFGELLKSFLLKERADVPVARSAPLIFAERLMDLAALFVLGLSGFAWQHSPLLAVGVASVVVLAGLAFGKSRRLASLVIDVLCRIPKLSPFRQRLTTAHASLYELWRLPPYTIATVLSLLSWGTQAWILVVLARALPGTVVTFPQALIAYAAPLVAGSLSLLPGGLGFTEASMAGALRALSGLPATVAATLTIVFRGVTFWLAVAVGFSTLALWHMLSKSARERLRGGRSERGH